MICVYCGKTEKELGIDNKFSQEHILPKSLIGTPLNNPFTINNVCVKCNNNAGRFIDAPATKSWFMQQKMAIHAIDYAKIEEHPVLPLIFMGKSKDFIYENKICDVWTGPAGDTIFHFHNPYPESKKPYPAVTGIPSYLNKRSVDKGFVFIFISSTSDDWQRTTLKSCLKKFEGSTFFLGNSTTQKGGVFSEIPAELISIREKLINHEILGVSFEFSPDGENRFLAKVALGIGAKYLGDDFINSDEAKELRKYMWAHEEDRKKMVLNGANFFNPKKPKVDILGMFGWEGGHLITLMNLPEGVILTVTLYNSIWATIKINKSTHNYYEKIGNGISIVIIPALNRVVGPIKYIQFLNHKLKMSYENPELKEVELELQKRLNKPLKC